MATKYFSKSVEITELSTMENNSGGNTQKYKITCVDADRDLEDEAAECSGVSGQRSADPASYEPLGIPQGVLPRSGLVFDFLESICFWRRYFFGGDKCRSD